MATENVNTNNVNNNEDTHEDTRVVITITRNHIPFSKMMDFVEAIIRLSFDENGNYHKYLRDYAEALTVLEVYTDYIDGKDKQDFDTVMAIRHSKLWYESIVPAIQTDYDVLMEYLEEETERATAPLADFGKTIKVIGEAASKILEVAKAIKVDELSDLNLSELEEALANIKPIE